MGLADFFSDIVSSLGIPEAQAEAPPQDVETSSAESAEKADESTEDTPEDSSEEAPEEEEEEEEEEEAVDIKPKLEEGELFELHFSPLLPSLRECCGQPRQMLFVFVLGASTCIMGTRWHTKALSHVGSAR